MSLIWAWGRDRESARSSNTERGFDKLNGDAWAQGAPVAFVRAVCYARLRPLSAEVNSGRTRVNHSRNKPSHGDKK